MSVGEKPLVAATNVVWSTCSFERSGTNPRQMASRASSSGNPMGITESKRPCRRKAGSRARIRLVAQISRRPGFSRKWGDDLQQFVRHVLHRRGWFATAASGDLLYLVDEHDGMVELVDFLEGFAQFTGETLR